MAFTRGTELQASSDDFLSKALSLNVGLNIRYIPVQGFARSRKIRCFGSTTIDKNVVFFFFNPRKKEACYVSPRSELCHKGRNSLPWSIDAVEAKSGLRKLGDRIAQGSRITDCCYVRVRLHTLAPQQAKREKLAKQCVYYATLRQTAKIIYNAKQMSPIEIRNTRIMFAK